MDCTVRWKASILPVKDKIMPSANICHNNDGHGKWWYYYLRNWYSFSHTEVTMTMEIPSRIKHLIILHWQNAKMIDTAATVLSIWYHFPMITHSGYMVIGSRTIVWSAGNKNSPCLCGIDRQSCRRKLPVHYNDVIMSTMASQITSPTIVYSTIYSGTDHRKHQSSASLAFVRGIHRWPVNSPHKWPVTRKMFPFDYVIMYFSMHMHIWLTISSGEAPCVHPVN